MPQVTITEELTGKQWVLAPFPTSPPFMFNGPPWDPGIYKIANNANGSVDIVLFGQSFTLPDQTVWRFMAHENMESFNWIGGAPLVGQERYPNNILYNSYPAGSSLAPVSPVPSP